MSVSPLSTLPVACVEHAVDHGDVQDGGESRWSTALLSPSVSPRRSSSGTVVADGDEMKSIPPSDSTGREPTPLSIRPSSLPLIYRSPPLAGPDHRPPSPHQPGQAFSLRTPPPPRSRMAAALYQTRVWSAHDDLPYPPHAYSGHDRPLPYHSRSHPYAPPSIDHMRYHSAPRGLQGRIPDLERGERSFSSPAIVVSPGFKAPRKRADDVQLNVLTEVFERTSYPTTEEREDLARKLGMTSRSVQIWFQNRRRAVKVEQQSAIQRVEANDRVAEAKARGLPGPAYLVDAGQGGLMIGGGDVKREEKSQERGMTRPL